MNVLYSIVYSVMSWLYSSTFKVFGCHGDVMPRNYNYWTISSTKGLWGRNLWFHFVGMMDKQLNLVIIWNVLTLTLCHFNVSIRFRATYQHGFHLIIAVFFFLLLKIHFTNFFQHSAINIGYVKAGHLLEVGIDSWTRLDYAVQFIEIHIYKHV